MVKQARTVHIQKRLLSEERTTVRAQARSADSAVQAGTSKQERLRSDAAAATNSSGVVNLKVEGAASVEVVVSTVVVSRFLFQVLAPASSSGLQLQKRTVAQAKSARLQLASSSVAFALFLE